MKQWHVGLICLGIAGFLMVGCGSSGNNNNNTNNTNNTNNNANHNDNHNHNQSTTNTLNVELSWGSQEAKKGQNELVITVTDKEKKPVEKATVTVDPQMPSMGHGSSEQAKVEELGQGKYKAHPVTFQMGGEWELTVHAKKGDDSGKMTVKLMIK